MIKVLFIAPYKGMAETLKNLLPIDNFDIDIIIENLENAVDVSLKYENKYDLIITRGGTATLVNEVVEIPVIEIDINSYDIARVLSLTKNIDDNIALIGYENFTKGAKIISEILNYNVEIYQIQKTDDLKDIFGELQKRNITTVIGDVITVAKAQNYGIRGVLLTSGEEAILKSIKEGERFLSLYSKLVNVNNLYNEVFKSLDTKYIILNSETLEVINTNLLNEEVILQLQKTISVSNQIKNDVVRLNIQSQIYELKKLPILNSKYLAFELQKVSRVDELTKISDLNEAHRFVGYSEWSNKILKNKKEYAKLHQLLIYGEKYTSKRNIAIYIFNNKNNNNELYELDFSRINYENLELLKWKISTINKATILFNNLEKNKHLKLLKELKLLINIDCDCIINIHLSDELSIQKTVSLNLPKLFVPKLSDRIQDLKPNIDMILTNLHIDYGSQIIGVSGNALDILKTLPWENNFKELENKIYQLTQISSSNYINESDVQKAIKKWRANTFENIYELISSNATLQEIEEEIILKVYELENRNKSKTASRLNITRTTLWKKLKKMGPGE
ncbi:sigma-54-dependent transcriptional regulator [Staphylococcus cohnii]|nr:sigma-54-dependent transcriptional regulator [Staphylococcus cohnii]